MDDNITLRTCSIADFCFGQPESDSVQISKCIHVTELLLPMEKPTVELRKHVSKKKQWQNRTKKQ